MECVEHVMNILPNATSAAQNTMSKRHLKQNASKLHQWSLSDYARAKYVEHVMEHVENAMSVQHYKMKCV